MAGLKLGLPSAEYVDRTSPELGAIVREVKAEKRVAIDTETTGLVRWRDYPLFWSLAWGNRRLCLNVDCLPAFGACFDDPDKEWIFQNAKYDMHMLSNVGVELKGKILDIRVMHCLLYEELEHNLGFMAKQLLGWTWKDGMEDWDKRAMPNVGDYWRWLFANDPQKLIQYASFDAYGTLELYKILKKELEAAWCHSLYPKEYGNLWDIFYKTEVPFTRVLWTCERNGLFVDKSYLKTKEVPAQKMANELRKQLTTIYQSYKPGKLFNPNSVLQVRDWFFEYEKRKPLRMTKPGKKTGVKNPSADKAFLDDIKGESEMARLLLEFRRIDKTLGTYIIGLQNSEAIDPDGIIHPQFNQDVARTGRLSSEDPNAQNIGNPEKDTFQVRGAFQSRPWEDETLICADQAQLEMRLLAAAAGEKDMIQIFNNGWDIHIGNAAMVFNVPYEDIKAAKKKSGHKEAVLSDYEKTLLEYRRRIKNIGFGLNYGMKERKLAADLGITIQEAEGLIKKYMDRYPAVQHFYKESVENARQYGYAFTLLGRRRYLPELQSSNEMDRWTAERQATNLEIQGTAADVMKLAMIHIHDANLEKRFGCYMALQVHDELVFRCQNSYLEEAKKEVREMMEHPLPTELAVPLIVSMDTANNWAAAKG